MRKLRIFIVELVLVALLVGWYVLKFPETLDPIIPWILWAIFVHLTWEIFLEREAAKSYVGGILIEKGKRPMIWLIAFLLGGLVSVCYIWLAQSGVKKLTEVGKSHKLVEQSSPSAQPVKDGDDQPLTAARRQRFTDNMLKLDIPEKDVLYEFVLDGFQMMPYRATEVLAKYGHSSYRGEPLASIEHKAGFMRASFHGHYEVNEEMKSFLKEWATTYTASPPVETHKAQQPEREIGKPPTFSDLFKQDFPNVLKMSNEFTLKRHKDGGQIPIKRQVYMDFDVRTDFIGFYIPSSDQFSDETFQICQALLDVVEPTILSVKQGNTQAWGGYKGQGTKSTELVFSGRVFIYHEGSLSITQKASLIESYKSKGYDIQFRGLLDYGADQMAEWYHQHGFPQPDNKQP